MKALQDHASEGLRTLLVCERYITQEFFESWLDKYNLVHKDMGPNKNERLEKVCGLLECNLNVIGSTGLQDNLQDGVIECISKLQQAHIKIWMLTGDKEDTAVNTGFASGLLDNETPRILISSSKH